MIDVNKLPPALKQYWPLFQFAGNLHGIDPGWLAAICWRETQAGTSGDLDKMGPGGRGDCENGTWFGHGLMQIDSRFHQSFLNAYDGSGRNLLWTIPEFNILYGTGIVKNDLNHLNGNILAAICSYNAGPSKALAALHSMPFKFTDEELITVLDQYTANHDYVTYVVQHFKEWQTSV